MRILVLEDDLMSRILLQKILSEFGEVVAVVNGNEAIQAHKSALSSGLDYDLICLDIMVPEIDGQAVLYHIREFEEQLGKDRLNERATIVMITALNDKNNLMTAFNHQCEGYILKPFSKEKIEQSLLELGLVKTLI